MLLILGRPWWLWKLTANVHVNWAMFFPDCGLSRTRRLYSFLGYHRLYKKTKPWYLLTIEFRNCVGKLKGLGCQLLAKVYTFETLITPQLSFKLFENFSLPLALKDFSNQCYYQVTENYCGVRFIERTIFSYIWNRSMKFTSSFTLYNHWNEQYQNKF